VVLAGRAAAGDIASGSVSAHLDAWRQSDPEHRGAEGKDGLGRPGAQQIRKADAATPGGARPVRRNVLAAGSARLVGVDVGAGREKNRRLCMARTCFSGAV